MKIEKEKLVNGLSKEDKIKISNLLDKYLIYQKNGTMNVNYFLDPREIELWNRRVKGKISTYWIIDRYPDSEKKIIWFGEKEDGIKEITIYYGTCNRKVEHREVLGSLFGIGLNASTIGDIFITEEGFYITNLTRMNTFLEKNLTKIGSTPVHLEKKNEIVLDKNPYQSMTVSVSSMRLDTIISKLACTSRTKAQELISNHFIIVNYQEELRGTYLLKENDILSIRKVGKFKIGKICKSTKKNHLVLEIKKYC